MKTDEVELKVEKVTCPSCDIELDLDEYESKTRKFKCPECGEQYELDSLSIVKVTADMVNIGRFPFSSWDWFEIWLAPFLMLSFSIYLFFEKPIDSIIIPPLKYGSAILGIFNLYRAAISGKFAFVPSNDAITKKISIVRQLQEKCEWEISEGKGGSFVFIDSTGLSRQEILIVCKENGYYLHCMARPVNLGSGVSVFQTRRVIKMINQISNGTLKDAAATFQVTH